mgnify:CR=1 FL=1
MRKLAIYVVLIACFGFLFMTEQAMARGFGAGAGKWTILTYEGEEGPFPYPVSSISGGGVYFEFLNTPDRAVLISDAKGKASLVGRTVTAYIAIEATAGATFNYYNTGGTLPANVRLYFQRVNGMGDSPTEECPSGWHPERPDCEAQYWWSNPESISLADLAAIGISGEVLSANLDPALWSDRDGHMGDSNVDHQGWFADAVANMGKAGLSFGGGNNFAFGCGVNSPYLANFDLFTFKIK